ncbi:hypothetical protein [Nonomuraea rubra]|uniref:hypothetical protein n=1 Tax=Nonomuraea rubra TaxID=46180 RepID=UPI0033F186C7
MIGSDDGALFLTPLSGGLGKELDAQLATAGLVLSDPGSGRVPASREFLSNEDFWESVFAEKLRSRYRVRLQDFFLLEWFPRSPGLYHTPDAEWSRRTARAHFFTLPGDELERYRSSEPESPQVYTLDGKTRMLRGGYGCIRLRDRLTEDGRLWFMSASSSLVAHEGVPVGLTESAYDQVIEDIAVYGAVRAHLAGRVMFLPDAFTPLYSDYRRVPPLYVRVDRVEPLPMRWDTMSRKPLASAAVIFRSQTGSESLFEYDRYAAAYIDFVPGERGTLTKRIPWLVRYVETLHEGRIITDFDEYMPRFTDAVFSLEKISQGRLRPEEVANVFEGGGRRVNIENLFVQQNQLNVIRARMEQQVVMGDNFSDIGAGATIVNRSLLVNALNRVATRDGEDVAQALRVITEHVAESGDEAARENLDGLMEELDRPEPRKARLKTFWNGLVDAAPGVAQLGEAASKIMGLFA